MHPRRPRYVHSCLTAALAVLLVVASRPAVAQDALGAGDALDASLSTRSRRNASSARTDFRSRNLLITGDVAGGRGFRGSVGYEAAGDFSGALGSNDLFSFRAGSVYSSPGLIQFGNAYTQLRMGSVGSSFEFRRDGYAPGSIDLSQAAMTRVQTRQSTSTAQSVFDRISADRLLANQVMSATPQTVGVVYDEQGRASFIESSPLRGLSIRAYEDAAADEGGSLLGRAADAGARTRADRASRREQVIAPFTTMRTGDERAGDDERSDGRVQGAAESSRVNAATGGPRDAYARILQRVADRYAVAQDMDIRFDPEMLRRLGVEYDQLRTQLATREPPGQRLMPDERLPGDPIAPGAPEQPGQPQPQTERTDDVTALIRPEAGRTLEQFNIVLRHGEVIQTLVGEADDRFNEIIAEGEQRLRISDFFLAERSFERALRMVRGHPLASAGYGHAQLGAGLYRTSCVTLRTLLTEHPAMIDVRYQTGLIPNRVRLLNTIAKLEERLREDDFDQEINGFLLAYIGHQMERDDLVARGLDAMLEADADDPLVPLLRAVWQAENQAAGGDDDAATDDATMDDDSDGDAAGGG